MHGPDPLHMVVVGEDSQEGTAQLCGEVGKHKCVCPGILPSVVLCLCLGKGNFCSHPFRLKCISLGISKIPQSGFARSLCATSPGLWLESTQGVSAWAALGM